MRFELFTLLIICMYAALTTQLLMLHSIICQKMHSQERLLVESLWVCYLNQFRQELCFISYCLWPLFGTNSFCQGKWTHPAIRIDLIKWSIVRSVIGSVADGRINLLFPVTGHSYTSDSTGWRKKNACFWNGYNCLQFLSLGLPQIKSLCSKTLHSRRSESFHSRKNCNFVTRNVSKCDAELWGEAPDVCMARRTPSFRYNFP